MFSQHVLVLREVAATGTETICGTFCYCCKLKAPLNLLNPPYILTTLLERCTLRPGCVGISEKAGPTKSIGEN